MKRIILFIALLTGTVFAQENRIAEFSVWEPLPGQEGNFQIGYKKHLQWRKSVRDSWEWHAWKIVSGPRSGQFITATFDHYWSDFDRAANPAEDHADKTQHVYPFVEVRSVHKASFLKSSSIGTTQSLRSKSSVLRMITLKVTDIIGAARVVDRFRAANTNNSDISYLLAFKKIDGGEINELYLFIGFESWELFGKSEGLQELLLSMENALKIKVIQSIRSETLVQQPDLSFFPGEEHSALRQNRER
jgi:hypothetical protein